MAKKATKRREWTADHVRTLKTLAREKKHASSIARTLKRTEGATRQKAFSMGLSLDLEGLRVRADQEVSLVHKAPPPCAAFY